MFFIAYLRFHARGTLPAAVLEPVIDLGFARVSADLLPIQHDAEIPAILVISAREVPSPAASSIGMPPSAVRLVLLELAFPLQGCSELQPSV